MSMTRHSALCELWRTAKYDLVLKEFTVHMER